jgi:hypothetical protein
MGFAAFGVGGLVGLLAGFGPDGPARTEASPADIVASRFQAEPGRVASGEAVPARLILASAAAEPINFSLSPNEAAAPARAPGAGTAPSAAEPEPLTGPSTQATADRLVASAKPAAAPARAAASNNVLNTAQIASLRERLRLTPYQEQLWPPVESALRDIVWRPTREKSAAKNAIRGGTIDPDSAPVQRLKSAAVPLIMSMSENQKEEVRTMARLMGLENLASRF